MSQSPRSLRKLGPQCSGTQMCWPCIAESTHSTARCLEDKGTRIAQLAMALALQPSKWTCRWQAGWVSRQHSPLSTVPRPTNITAAASWNRSPRSQSSFFTRSCRLEVDSLTQLAPVQLQAKFACVPQLRWPFRRVFLDHPCLNIGSRSSLSHKLKLHGWTNRGECTSNNKFNQATF